MRPLRIIATVVACLALLAIGGVAIVTTPTGDALNGSIRTYGAPGHPIRAHELVLTVDGVTAARTLRDDPGTATTGVWIVIDVTAEAVASQQAVQFAQLRLGDVVYTEPQDVTQPLITVDAGVRTRGALVFEVSRAALRDHGAQATLEVPTGTDVVPEGIPAVRMDLSGLAVQRTVDVAPAEVIGR
jgi:hypothetical protein